VIVDERRDQRSLGQLFGDLTRQLSTLVRQEIELARTEVTSRASAAGRDAALVGIGGALLYAGFLGLMAAVTLWLVDAGLDPWVAALVVAGVVLAIGVVLVLTGRQNLNRLDLAPKRTTETLRDDAKWAKEQLT
jgi:hypothetical protein